MKIFQFLPVSKILTFSMLVFLSASCASKKPPKSGVSVARMEVKEPIPGVCDNENVMALSLMSFLDKNAIDAKCALSEAEMEKKLNDNIPFLKENPDFEGKGMVGMIVNCVGEVVQCKIDIVSGNVELDNQILKVFNTFTSWQAGSHYGKPVDSVQLFSYNIAEGKITM